MSKELHRLTNSLVQSRTQVEQARFSSLDNDGEMTANQNRIEIFIDKKNLSTRSCSFYPSYLLSLQAVGRSLG